MHKFTHTAGLVLLWPYFATLFKRLGLIEGRKFGSFEDQVKAINFLIYLSNGQSQDLPQKHLYLERILCGIPSLEILPDPEAITPSEQELIDDMLRAVIGHWSALGTTSVEGLRESFIRRDGDIQETDESTILTVAPKAFDMLLDRLPWSISITKLTWMEKPLTINWRN